MVPSLLRTKWHSFCYGKKIIRVFVDCVGSDFVQLSPTVKACA